MRPGPAGGRVASEGRSTAASEQMRVMWSEQLEMIAVGSDVPLVPKALANFSPFISPLISNPRAAERVLAPSNIKVAKRRVDNECRRDQVGRERRAPCSFSSSSLSPQLRLRSFDRVRKIRTFTYDR